MTVSMRRKSKAQGKQIAIIEEVANNIYSMKFVLDSLGFEARSYEASEGCLQKLLEFSPQLIVVDMMISNRGGYEIIRDIRGSKLRRVPILAITADAMEGGEKEIYAAGGKDILAKPYSVNDLKRKLEKWLS